MVIEEKLKPIAKAMIENLNKKDPEEIIFIVGKKLYRAKEIINHVKKEDKVAKIIIHYALKANGCCKEKKTLILSEISEEDVRNAVKMFMDA